MKLRQVLIGALAIGVGLMYGASAQAESSFSANVKLTTDYVFQGASDSDGNPAIQGGLDWSHGTGLYAGVWGSNVASASSDTGDSVGGIELDYYAGYSRKISDRVGVTVGALYIHYPEGDSNTDVWESFAQLKAAVSFDAGFAGFGFDYRHVFSDNKQNRFILNASLPVIRDRELPVTLKATYGFNDREDNEAAADYTWYLVGVGAKLHGFGLDVFYSGRFLIDSDDEDPDPIVGASISRSF